ncbi:MFS transporter [Anaerofilum sp. BX8]|uniref:MFS transporter n=1 Tax=Anaerofilum hominis TaxID=2763016 RepID=A0A923I758_9FIRM|nr:MFS transporter [Anaerofilum hominis]MBC5581538.1 MFS transporter [Anaerofilum hominis]
MKKKKIHYAWVVFASCILLKMGLGGAVMCIAGNFVTPVVAELGCQVSQFTMLVSVEAAAMALMYTTAAKVLTTRRIGRVMGIAALAEVAGIALMATYRSVWMFYLSGAIVGVGVAFTGFVAIPIVVNMWFRKKAGTVLGIIVAAEGISTVLFTLITAQLIVGLGWRMAYVVMAAVCLVVSVPALFLFVKSPEEAGCEPYGSDEAAAAAETAAPAAPEWGLTRRQALRSPVFYMVWITCMLYSVGCGVQQYIANFSTMELGQSIPYGATAAMCMSLGCVASSVILGYVNDRFGVRAGLGWGALFILLGYGGMLYSISNPGFVIPSALLVGLGGSMYTVQCPLLARTALGSRDYSSIWSVMMTGNSLVGAFTFSSIGLFYDVGGSYKGAFLMAMGLYVGAFVLGSAAVGLGKKLVQRAQA